MSELVNALIELIENDGLRWPEALKMFREETSFPISSCFHVAQKFKEAQRRFENK